MDLKARLGRLESLHDGMFENVTIRKLGRTVCVYSMVQRREKKKDSRYIQEASAPAAVTVCQTCNIMYTCNRELRERTAPARVAYSMERLGLMGSSQTLEDLLLM